MCVYGVASEIVYFTQQGQAKNEKEGRLLNIIGRLPTLIGTLIHLTGILSIMKS